MNHQKSNWQRHQIWSLATLAFIGASAIAVARYFPHAAMDFLLIVVILMMMMIVSIFFKAHFKDKASMFALSGFLLLGSPMITHAWYVAPPASDTVHEWDFSPRLFQDPTHEPPPQQVGIIPACVVGIGVGALIYIGMKSICTSAGIWPTNTPPPPPPPPNKVSPGKKKSLTGDSEYFPALIASEGCFSIYDAKEFGYRDSEGVLFDRLTVVYLQSSTNLNEWGDECFIRLWQNPYRIVTALYDSSGNLIESVINPMPAPPNYDPIEPTDELTAVGKFLRVDGDVPIKYFRLSPGK